MNLNEIFSLLMEYRYFLIFPITFFEGPIITVIAGFLCSIDVMEVPLVYAIVVTADLAGDFMYYGAGRYGREGLAPKWGKYAGITPERLAKLEDHFKEHPGKTLLAGKLFHGVGGAVLFTAGAAKMRALSFLWFNFLGTMPKSLILLFIGYRFGEYLSRIKSVIDIVALVFIGLAGAGLLYFLYHGKRKPV